MTRSVAMVRTVLGDIEPAQLGVCDAHDHLFLASPAIPGTPLDDPAAAASELAAFASAGGQSLVQWSPAGTGRRATDLVAASEHTGVHVIAATGMHRAAHYQSDDDQGPKRWPANLDADALAALFVSELTIGIRTADDEVGTRRVRAGIIKVGAGYHALDDHERRALDAAAAAHRQTGAAVCVHLELGTHALAVLNRLRHYGVPSNRVVLGHLGRNPDLPMHQQVADTGAFLALDGPSRATHATDWRLLDVIDALVRTGHGDQILLGADSVTSQARASTGGGPGTPAILTTTARAVRDEHGADVHRSLLVDNPARAFSWQT